MASFQRVGHVATTADLSQRAAAVSPGGEKSRAHHAIVVAEFSCGGVIVTPPPPTWDRCRPRSGTSQPAPSARGESATPPTVANARSSCSHRPAAARGRTPTAPAPNKSRSAPSAATWPVIAAAEFGHEGHTRLFHARLDFPRLLRLDIHRHGTIDGFTSIAGRQNRQRPIPLGRQHQNGIDIQSPAPRR